METNRRTKTEPATAHDVDRSPAASAHKEWYKNDLLPTLLLAGLLLLTYANTLHDTGFPFDNESILQDSRLHAVTLENLRLILTQDYWWSEGIVSGLYRPATTLSYLFNYAVLGNEGQAAGYHLINLLLHLANVWLVYFLFLGILKERVPAFFTAAVYGIHPINVEAVTNIVGRADLLATLAVLGGIHCFVRAATSTDHRKHSWLLALAVISTLGVFSKETGMLTLPLVILYDLAFRPRPVLLVNSGRPPARFFLPGYSALLPSLLFFALAHRMVFAGLEIYAVGFLDNPLTAADFLTARVTAVKVIGRYLALLLWPHSLSSDYSYNQIPLAQWPFSGWEDWQILAVLIVICLATVTAVRSYLRNRIYFFLILFFTLAYLPTSNLLPRPGESIFAKESWLIGSMMAERFMYLPSIGFAGGLVLAVYALGNFMNRRTENGRLQFPQQPQVTMVILLSLMVAALAGRAYLRNFDWENELTLAGKDVLASPNSQRLHGMVAWALFLSDPGGTQIDRVIAHGEKAIAIAGDSYEPLFTRLGIYSMRKGDLLGAAQGDAGPTVSSRERREWYEKAVKALYQAATIGNHQTIDSMRRRGEKAPEGPDALAVGGDPETYYQLGIALRALGRKTEAFKAFRNLRQVAVYDYRGYVLMANLYEEANDPAGAARLLLQTVLLDNRAQGIVDSLARIYQKMPGGECAIQQEQGKAAMNFICPLVQQHICEANVQLVELLLSIGDTDTAWRFVPGSIRVFGCDQKIYDHLIPK